jgi:hypothetical protein
LIIKRLEEQILKLLYLQTSALILTCELAKSQVFAMVSSLFADSNLAAPEQFGVDFGKFGQLTLKFHMRGDALVRLPPLFGRFEQILSHVAGSQTLHQVIKRTVLESALTATILFAAGQKLFDVGRPHQIRGNEHLFQQRDLPLFQGFNGRLGRINCLNHIYS